MSLQVTPPRGRSEPVALPTSCGFSGSPVPDPLREYVTLIVSADAVGAAQMLNAKAQVTAGKKVLVTDPGRIQAGKVWRGASIWLFLGGKVREGEHNKGSRPAERWHGSGAWCPRAQPQEH
jgi:hypothetical protein